MSKSSDFMLLYHALRRERHLKLLATILILSGGIAFMVLIFLANTVSLSLVCALAAMSLMVLGFKFLYETLTVWQTEKHPLWQQVTQQPKDIVWVYTKIVETSPYGLQVSGHAVMYFKLINGGEWNISVSRRRVRALSESLNPALPHATFGYSVERAQWYVADPYLLIRDSYEVNS